MTKLLVMFLLLVSPEQKRYIETPLVLAATMMMETISPIFGDDDGGTTNREDDDDDEVDPDLVAIIPPKEFSSGEK